MNKPGLNNHLQKYRDLMSYALSLTTLCLLVTWAIESLASEWLRSG